MAALNTEGFADKINPQFGTFATIDRFKQYIREQQGQLEQMRVPPNKRTPLHVGAVCLQDVIRKRLKRMKQQKGGNKKLLERRLKYFSSNKFTEQFCKPLAYNDKYREKKLKNNYSNFFKSLFDVTDTPKIRAELEHIKPQSQCITVLGKSKPKKTGLQVDEPCYICGRDIIKQPNNESKECEHILPIMTALTHWWLVQDTSERPHIALEHEYKWAHRCCNQKKTDYDFIIYDSGRGMFVVNDSVLTDLLNDILRESNSYDCRAITKNSGTFDVNREKIRVGQLVTPIIEELNIINDNLTDNSRNGRDEFMLLCKFKLISALSNTTFDDIISGSETFNTAKKKQVEKSKKTRKANVEAERDNEIQNKIKSTTATKMDTQIRNERIKNRNFRKGSGIRKARGLSADEQGSVSSDGPGGGGGGGSDSNSNGSESENMTHIIDSILEENGVIEEPELYYELIDSFNTIYSSTHMFFNENGFPPTIHTRMFDTISEGMAPFDRIPRSNMTELGAEEGHRAQQTGMFPHGTIKGKRGSGTRRTRKKKKRASKSGRKSRRSRYGRRGR